MILKYKLINPNTILKYSLTEAPSSAQHTAILDVYLFNI